MFARHLNGLRAIALGICALLLSVAFAPPASAQTYYIYHWGIGNAGGDGDWATFESAGQAAVDYLNSVTFNPLYTLGSCTAGGPTVPGIADACHVYYGGNLYGDVFATSQGATPAYWLSANPTPRSSVATQDCVCDPINPAVGNVYATEEDVRFSGPGAINFRRFYSSAETQQIENVPSWRHSYTRSVATVYQAPASNYPGQSSLTSTQYSTPSAACIQGFSNIQASVSAWAGATVTYNNGLCVLSKSSTTIGTIPIQHFPALAAPPTPVEYDVIRDDGQILRYTLPNGVINNPHGISLRLGVTGTGFTVTDDNDNVEFYDTNGVLQSITSRSGVVQTITHDSQGLFSGVTDSFGNSLTVTRNIHRQIQSLGVSGGGSVTYQYDGSFRLVAVNNLDSTQRVYKYNNTTYPLALTGIQDESGKMISTWGYDTAGRATSTSGPGGADAASLVYNGDGSVTITDALGAVRTFSYTRIGDIDRSSGISGSQCPTCEDSAATTYDAYGFLASRTDYNGNLTCYANDPNRGLELVRIEGFAPGSSCPADLSSYTPAAGTTERKISTAWSASFRLPTQITEATRTTTFGYDPSGNMLTRTITDTTVTPNVARTWTYTHNSYGQVLTVDGPRTDVSDVTTYTYYTCTTGFQCGQVHTITDAAGNLTTFNSYDAYGQPLALTDPNGVLTTLTYDARERLISRTVGGETTGFTYYPTGLLKTTTRADGSTLTYTYDDAHRLTKIADSLGNSIVYQPDAMGNYTAVSVYDPGNNLIATHSSPYNSLSQRYQDLLSAGTAGVTTTYGYDGNGNLQSISAPLGRTTANTYDALNRLKQVTDPGSGITQFGYDSNDQLLSVQDPRGLITSYVHDGFGEVSKTTSPDTGVVTQTYDRAGNLATSNDTRGVSGTYTYDASDRLMQVQLSSPAGSGIPAVTDTFSYDMCTNGKGRLCQITDASGSTAWTYTPQGRVSSKTQTLSFDNETGAVARTVGYQYTNGLLTTLTLPSGIVVSYTYNAAGRVASITANLFQPGMPPVTVLSNVTYDFSGNVTGWTWGNGTHAVRAFDMDGRISTINSAGATVYGYDNASRLTSMTSQPGNPAPSWVFGYDTLDRLNSAQQPAQSLSYTYDADGNRQTQSGTTSATYTYASSPASNHLASVTAGSVTQSYTYDAAGNTTSDGNYGYFYDAVGRLIHISSGFDYFYNALGQRVGKQRWWNGNDVFYAYDEQGHLLEKCVPALPDFGCNPWESQFYIWLGDIPVATVLQKYSLNSDGDIEGGAPYVFYIHTDQLGTPRVLTDHQDQTNTPVWRWDSDPFGEGGAVNVDPSGTGMVLFFDLRFPGQVFDEETGKHSNGARDYDPATGRYIESDPIGLMGRSYSTYSYVNSNPLSAIDPFGLNPYQPSPVTALEEAILQGNVEAVQTLAEAAGLPSDQASAALARAAANANKINHIFGKAAHNLDRLVQACGSRGKALQDILDAGAKNFSKVPNGVVKDISVTINGVQVTVRGIMINGQFNLSTAFIP